MNFFKDFLIFALLPLIVIMLISCMGCASVHYTKNIDGTEEFVYKRIGQQEIGNFKANVGPDGLVNIELKQQKGDAGILDEALKDISAAVLKLAGPMP